MIVVCVFGYIQKSGYIFVGVYMSCYVLYIIATLVAEQMDLKEEELAGNLKDDNDIEG